MGYESSGNGYFRIKDHYDPEFTTEMLTQYFESVEYTKSPLDLNIWFNCGRIYNMDEEFRYLLDTCDGEMEIQGESGNDIWKIKFQDGLVSVSNGMVVFEKFKNTTLEEIS